MEEAVVNEDLRMAEKELEYLDMDGPSVERQAGFRQVEQPFCVGHHILLESSKLLWRCMYFSDSSHFSAHQTASTDEFVGHEVLLVLHLYASMKFLFVCGPNHRFFSILSHHILQQLAHCQAGLFASFISLWILYLAVVDQKIVIVLWE